MRRVVMYSGGVASWATAMRVAERHGTTDLVLLFADTNMEDEDLYRFLREGSALVGVPITRIADGRTPWDVFRDVRFLGNTRVDPCSRILKRALLDRWLAENCDPASTIAYVGIDWTEEHRFTRAPGTRGPKDKGGLKERRALDGWRYEAPLCEPPLLDKQAALDWLRSFGVRPPRLYEMGFPHNNCGGFCVKAGQAHFRLLMERMPERYAFHEERENEIRRDLGDVSILRDRRGGKVRPLTLTEFRESVQRGAAQIDAFEWGGCGCAIDDAADLAALEAE